MKTPILALIFSISAIDPIFTGYLHTISLAETPQKLSEEQRAQADFSLGEQLNHQSTPALRQKFWQKFLTDHPMNLHTPDARVHILEALLDGKQWRTLLATSTQWLSKPSSTSTLVAYYSFALKASLELHATKDFDRLLATARSISSPPPIEIELRAIERARRSLWAPSLNRAFRNKESRNLILALDKRALEMNETERTRYASERIQLNLLTCSKPLADVIVTENHSVDRAMKWSQCVREGITSTPNFLPNQMTETLADISKEKMDAFLHRTPNDVLRSGPKESYRFHRETETEIKKRIRNEWIHSLPIVKEAEGPQKTMKRFILLLEEELSTTNLSVSSQPEETPTPSSEQPQPKAESPHKVELAPNEPPK